MWGECAELTLLSFLFFKLNALRRRGWWRCVIVISENMFFLFTLCYSICFLCKHAVSFHQRCLKKMTTEPALTEYTVDQTFCCHINTQNCCKIEQHGETNIYNHSTCKNCVCFHLPVMKSTKFATFSQHHGHLHLRCMICSILRDRMWF